MRKIIPNGEPQIIAEAKIGALVMLPVLRDSGDGYKEEMFEKFVRPPGTRIIAVKDEKIFLQNEHRLELENRTDWRLPGGKIMDSFKEHKEYIGKDIPEEVILNAAQRELEEEAGMKAQTIEIFKKSTCGALVDWDLYYVIAKDIEKSEVNHNEGEEIIDGKWFSFNEIKEMCLKGELEEDRTVATLIQLISNKI